jgi:DNA modification methylase
MEQAGPAKGDFVAPLEIGDVDEREDALPTQEEFWRPPVRFGSVPVEKEPLGWDRRRGFRKLFPVVSLPTQVVERVSFGHPSLEPNRLFWGDNLHVMRQLPSESIDLIYIDPPFFSGRHYNVIFGDQNELRSFSDIWEGGMPGYLIWLNARLYEMKRLLKPSGTIYVHLDWHAAHYVKVEMDKLFGHSNYAGELIWSYGSTSGGRVSGKKFVKGHDTILIYCREYGRHYFSVVYLPYKAKYITDWFKFDDGDGRLYRKRWRGKGVFERQYLDQSPGEPASTVTEVQQVYANPQAYRDDRMGSQELIGYPTQKPEALLERIVNASCPPGGLLADLFCGGGTTLAVAQRLGRRWIACDQSRVAVAITQDRLTRMAEQLTLSALTTAPDPEPEPRRTGLEPLQPTLGGDLKSKQPTLGEAETPPAQGAFAAIPDFTVEHWGVYEAKRLGETPSEQFREFVLRAFGASSEKPEPGIHGTKGAIPVWVGEPSQRSQVTAKEVEGFANAIRKTVRYQQDNLRDGIMLAWAFRPDALEAAERLRELEQTDLNFIRLDMLRIDSPRFREHVAALSTQHADYENFLTFVQPPRVEVGWKRLQERTYAFDVSETVLINAGAKIINVQWDFDYQKRFSSTPGYSFIRGKNKEPALQVQYEFPRARRYKIACKVQDDMGGEGTWTGELEVT